MLGMSRWTQNSPESSRIIQNHPGPALDLHRFSILQQGSAPCRECQSMSGKLSILLHEPVLVSWVSIQDELLAHRVSSLEAVRREHNLAPEAARGWVSPFDHFECTIASALCYGDVAHASSLIVLSLSRVTRCISARIISRSSAGISAMILTM